METRVQIPIDTKNAQWILFMEKGLNYPYRLLNGSHIPSVRLSVQKKYDVNSTNKIASTSNGRTHGQFFTGPRGKLGLKQKKWVLFQPTYLIRP